MRITKKRIEGKLLLIKAKRGIELKDFSTPGDPIKTLRVEGKSIYFKSYKDMNEYLDKILWERKLGR